MTRFLTLVFLVLALASTIAEARSKRIHVTAHVVEATFTGHPDNIQLGDQHIISVELRDKNGMPVGHWRGSLYHRQHHDRAARTVPDYGGIHQWAGHFWRSGSIA
jgi:hypothetical protein